MKDRGTIAGAVMNKTAYAVLIILPRHFYFAAWVRIQLGFLLVQPEGGEIKKLIHCKTDSQMTVKN